MGGGITRDGITLSPVQVSLRRLLDVLQVKGGDAGFLLSGAVVPIIDVTRLLEAEAGRGSLLVVDERIVDRSFNGSAGPHPDTARWTYTVPAGRRARLDTAFTLIARSAGVGAGVVGNIKSRVQLTRAGGGAIQLLQAHFLNGAIGSQDAASLANGVDMLAGDVLSGHTVDISTGTSAADYLVDAAIREFT